MTEKLKYKVGDKVMVQMEVQGISKDNVPYCLSVPDLGGISYWLSRKELENNVVNLPPKPKVPQVVMDWWEEHENERADWKISNWLSDIDTLEGMYDWLYGENHLENQHALATLIAYGPEAVEVEKEKKKKYRVLLKETKQYLSTWLDAFRFTVDRHEEELQYEFTKQELIDAGFEGVFDNPMFEVEEVEW
ncbi:DUF1642 domain-containing protein [Streptococcus sp. 10F2]